MGLILTRLNNQQKLKLFYKNKQIFIKLLKNMNFNVRYYFFIN
jgi:hypothetical protein